MKKSIALLLAICTFSGCVNTDVPEETTTTAATTAPETTTVTTTAPPVTTTVPKAEEAPDDGRIVPKKMGTELTYTLEKHYNYEDICEQLGTETPIDVTTVDGYKEAVEYAERLDVEERQQLIADNYTAVNLYDIYVGEEYADWFCVANYRLSIGSPINPFYSRLLYIKDNKIVKEIPFDEPVHNYYDFGGSIFISTYDSGIYELNMDTEEITHVIKCDDWTGIQSVSDDYIYYYISSQLRLYDRRSGEIIETEIYYNSQEGAPVKHIGNSLFYGYFENENIKFRELNLETREITDLDITSLDEITEENNDTGSENSEDYFISYDSKTCSLALVSDENETEKVYNLESVLKKQDYPPFPTYGMYNGFVYIGLDNNLILINPETDEMYMTEISSDAVSDDEFIYSEGGALIYHKDYNDYRINVTLPVTPVLLTDEPLISVKPEIDAEKIKEQLGYDTPVDITTDCPYKYALEYAEEQDEEYKQRLIEQNYSEIYLSYEYLGTDYADWLCTAEYSLVQVHSFDYPYYSRIFGVKDGKITETFFEHEGQAYNFERYNGDIFIPVWGKGIYRFDVETGKSELVVNKTDVYMIFSVTDKYILFNDSDCEIKIFNRDSGNIHHSHAWASTMDTHGFAMDGDFLYYRGYVDKVYPDGSVSRSYSSENPYMEFNMETGEEKISEITEEEYWKLPQNGSGDDTDDYIISRYGYNDYSTPPQTITITRKSDGVAKDFCIGQLEGVNYKRFDYLGMDGEYLYIRVNLRDVVVINVETNQAVIADTGNKHDSAYFELDGSTVVVRDLYDSEKVYGVEIGFEPARVEIIPEIVTDDVFLSRHCFVDNDEIINAIGYDTPVDITKHEWYDDAVAYSQEEWAESSEEHNYSYISLDYCYIGSEKADWLCTANYSFVWYVGTAYDDYYTKVFYIKDGKITEHIAQFENGVYPMYRYGKEIFIPVNMDGVYSLNTETNKLKKLFSVSDVCRVNMVNDNFIVFDDIADERVRVFNRKTSEIFTSDVYANIQEGQGYNINDSLIIYKRVEDGVWRKACMDMNTGEVKPYEGGDSYKYSWHYDDKGRFTQLGYEIIYDEEQRTLSFTPSSGGAERVYRLNGLHQAFSGENGKCLRTIGMKNDKYYAQVFNDRICVDGDYILILDLTTDTIRLADVSEMDWDSLYVLDENGLGEVVDVYGYNDPCVLKIDFTETALTDENGMLTAAYTSRISELISRKYNKHSNYHPYVALQDFDNDDIPEIVFIPHFGWQGTMECEIYHAVDLECIGKFGGFCRDGFTRFAKTDEGVLIHNYYEHSNWQRVETLHLAEMSEGELKFTELYNCYGQWNMVGAYNAGLLWDGERGSGVNGGDCERSKVFSKYLWQEAQEYCVSTFEYGNEVSVAETPEFITELYNSYKRLENTYKENSGYEKNEWEEWNFYAPADYDKDGKPEAFYQTNDDHATYFINSNCEISVFSENDNGYGTGYRAYKVWDYIVIQSMGNHSPDLVVKVENGKPRTVLDYGQRFDYSELYNGEFSLIQSAYDAPSHSWKPYPYALDENGELYELGAIEVDKDEFLEYYGEDAQKIFDEIAAMETPMDNGQNYEIRSIYYRGDMSYNVNYGWDILNEYITVKPKCVDGERGLVEFSRGGGIYLPAFNPDIAVYPDSAFPE